MLSDPEGPRRKHVVPWFRRGSLQAGRKARADDPKHDDHSTPSFAAPGSGRGTACGHSTPGGQLLDNQQSARSSRLTPMSAPERTAANLFPSLKIRDDKVASARQSAAPYRSVTMKNCERVSIIYVCGTCTKLSMVHVPVAETLVAVKIPR